MLLAGGGDGSEEVVAGGVAGDRACGVLLDGLDEASEGIVVEGALDIGIRDTRTGEDGDLLCKNTRPLTGRVPIVDNFFNCPL